MLEAAPLARGQWQGAERVQCRGIKAPKCWVLLACGTASPSPHVGYSSGVLLTEPSGSVLYSVQSMLPEAGGQVGEVPVTVSQE